MAGSENNVNPIISNQVVLSNTAIISSNTSVQNRQQVLGTNSPAANATRVAQANASNSKPVLPTDNEILEILFPGEMRNVTVHNFEASELSALVKDYGFNAWTNSSNDIYINEDITDNGFIRIYILYHEGLHIRQFVREKSSPKLFQNMLKFEILAYGKAAGWLQTKQANDLRVQMGMSDTEFRKLRRNESNTASEISRLGSYAGELHMDRLGGGFSQEEIDLIYLEAMIYSPAKSPDNKSTLRNSLSMLPDKYIDKDGTLRYGTDDLYKVLNKEYFNP